MDKYFFVGATLTLTVFAQIVMKSRAMTHVGQGGGDRIRYLLTMYTDLRVLSALGCGVAASICWSLALQRLPLTIAYPFMALSFVLVPLASVLFLRESVAWQQVAGISLIVFGVALSATVQS